MNESLLATLISEKRAGCFRSIARTVSFNLAVAFASLICCSFFCVDVVMKVAMSDSVGKLKMSATVRVIEASRAERASSMARIESPPSSKNESSDLIFASGISTRGLQSALSMPDTAPGDFVFSFDALYGSSDSSEVVSSLN